jgi:hypothetical protein
MAGLGPKNKIDDVHLSFNKTGSNAVIRTQKKHVRVKYWKHFFFQHFLLVWLF